MSQVQFRVNGVVVTGAASAQRLTSFLRDDLGLEGTKVGCDAGDCGACTVLVNGEPTCACMVPVGRLDGAEVTTVEHLSTTALGSRLQQALYLGAAFDGSRMNAPFAVLLSNLA